MISSCDQGFSTAYPASTARVKVSSDAERRASVDNDDTVLCGVRKRVGVFRSFGVLDPMLLCHKKARRAPW